MRRLRRRAGACSPAIVSRMSSTSSSRIGSIASAARIAGAAGVREHRRAARPRERTRTAERHRHVEQLLDRRGAQHAGLREQRIDGHIARRERAGVRRRRARPDARAAGLHDDDRLRLRDARRDLEEAARIAEVLHVHEDHAHRRVVLPLHEQVVAAHVRLVADGDELRDADAVLARVVEHAHAHRARLRHERGVAEGRHRRRERRVHGDAGSALMTPRQFGPTMRMPCRAHDVHERALARGALSAHFAETRR